MSGFNGFRTVGSDFRAVGRHHEYYIAGGDLFFLVDQLCYFRVHRHFFVRESSYFRKELGSPTSPGYEAIGSSDTSAVLLDVKVHEFEKLLWVFYNPTYDLYDTSTDDWAIILRLAHQWDFPRVKDLAVRHLEILVMPDIDRVALYQDHRVDRSLLVRWYANLCAREEPLTIEDGEKLKIQTAMTIARAREVLRSPTRGTSLTCSTPVDMEESALQAFIRESFNIPGGRSGGLSPRPTVAVPVEKPQPQQNGDTDAARTPQEPEKPAPEDASTTDPAATSDPHRVPPLIINDSTTGTKGVFGRGRGRNPPSARPRN